MKPSLLIAVFYAAINAAILGVIGLIVGFPASRQVHVVDEVRVPRMTTEEMGLAVLLDSGLLSIGDRPKLLVLGASGATRAFPPHLVEASLPGYDASNLAVPAALVSEMLEVFDEVFLTVSPAVLRRSVLVLGVTSMSFWPEAFPFSPVVEPRIPWWAPPRTRTFVTHAAARSPALLAPRHPVRRLIPRSLAVAAKQRFRCWVRLLAVFANHPGEWLAQRGVWRFQSTVIQRHPPLRADTPQRQPVPIKEQMEWHLAQAKRFGMPYDPRQVDAFVTLVRRAIACGMKVVVVDMPLHGEHLAHPAHFTPFKQRLAEAVAGVHETTHDAAGKVWLLDLTDALADEHFADLAHAAKGSRQVWVDLLVDRLRPLLADPPPSGDR